MRPIKGTGFVLAGALVLFGALVVNAQQVTGVISGRVTDEKGASVPGAKVTITAKATGRNIDLVTNDEGFFEARSLPSGNYNVKIEQQGFAGSLIENLVVQTGKVSDASVQLKVGNISETVTVQGTEAQLQVDTTPRPCGVPTRRADQGWWSDRPHQDRNLQNRGCERQFRNRYAHSDRWY